MLWCEAARGSDHAALAPRALSRSSPPPLGIPSELASACPGIPAAAAVAAASLGLRAALGPAGTPAPAEDLSLPLFVHSVFSGRRS